MNWLKFFSMGGYAFYVWGSYLLALIIMAGEVLVLLRRRKSLLERANQGSRSIGKDKNETTT